MKNSKTVLNCSATTAFLLFFLIGTLFVAAGCAQFYKAIGFDEDQVLEQVASDQKAISKIITTVRQSGTDLLVKVLAGAGAIASGFLAKWLGTERKITKTLINGIEKATIDDVKLAIKKEATAAGIESKLHKRVRALT